MDSASRDAVLRLLLPALAVVGIYVAWFSKQSDLDAARVRLTAARANAVSPAMIEPVRDELLALSTEQERLTKEKQALDERWAQMASLPQVSAVKRAQAMRQLTRMLWERGLYPFEEAPESQNGQIPQSFEDVVQRLAPRTQQSEPRLWKISFYGRYADVAETLDSLGDLNVALVPVGLTMSDAHPDTDWRIWTLTLWM